MIFLAYIASSLRACDYDVKVLDLVAEGYNHEEIVDGNLKNFTPDGMSEQGIKWLYTSTLSFSLTHRWLRRT